MNKTCMIAVTALLLAGQGMAQTDPIRITDYGVVVPDESSFTIRVEAETDPDQSIGSFAITLGRLGETLEADRIPPGFSPRRDGRAAPDNYDVRQGYLDNGAVDEDSRPEAFAVTFSTAGWPSGRHEMSVTAHNRPAPGPYIRDSRRFAVDIDESGRPRFVPGREFLTAPPNIDGQEIIIYREEGIYACFPSLYHEKEDDSLAVGFGRKITRRHIDERGPGSKRMISRDGGLTWHADDGSLAAVPPWVAGDGTEYNVGTKGWQRTDASERERLEREGVIVRDVRDGVIAYMEPYYLVRSRPGGDRSWHTETVRAPDYVRHLSYVHSNRLRTSGGVWLAAAYGRPVDSDKSEVFVLRSADEGQTWNFIRMPTAGEDIGFNEASLTETADGRILVMMRTEPAGYLWQSHSDDEGLSWSQPEATPMWGYPPHLLTLPDGRILCTYGYRRAPMGVRACLSRDGGRSWDVDSEFIIRGDGMHRGGDQGYPKSTVLSDGTIFTVYYITPYDNVTHIAGTRWQLP